ncbi:hypothetical protein D3C72_1994080 [compost metagenome]
MPHHIQRDTIKTLTTFHITNCIDIDICGTCSLISCFKITGTRTTQYHNNHIRQLRRRNRILYITIKRITDSTALHVINLCPLTYRSTDTSQYCFHFTISLRSSIVSQLIIGIIRIRTNNCNTFNRFLQRQ